MTTPAQKIVKVNEEQPNKLDEEIATALISIETSQSSDIKAQVRDIVISGSKEVETSKAEKVVVVFFPYKSWKTVKQIQGKLIRELEKKLKHKVILVANRTILDKNFKRKGLNLKIRPRSRTLTSVHDAILQDIVGPTEIVGKRTRISQDGNKLIKIILDGKDKEQTEERLDAFSSVYRQLTAKQAAFLYPSH